MFKKLLIANAILAASSSLVYAGAMGPVQDCSYMFQTGPYVGLSIGGQVNEATIPLIYNGITGTLSAGWGHLWNQRFYLAGEAYGSDSIKLYTYGMGDEPDYARNMISGWSYGFDILPGIMINDRILAYLRGGIVKSQFKANLSTGTAGTNPQGWKVGLGAQTNIYKNLDGRLEYMLSIYPTQVFPPLADVWTNQFNVGLVYKFA